MENARILWVDDEIDALKPHCLFLEARGFAVQTANNAADALQLVLAERWDAETDALPMGGWRRWGVTRCPRVGRGKKNVHFDPHGAAGACRGSTAAKAYSL